MTPQPADPTKTPEQLRQEAAEILHRRKRGLPGHLGKKSPQPAAPAWDSADKALRAGREALGVGHIAEALLHSDTAIGFAPAGSDALADGWTLQGNIRLRQGNPQAARAAFARALATNPAHIAARVGTAEAYLRMNQPARAVAFLVETIPLVPDAELRGRLRGRLADAYRAAGRPDAARRVLRLSDEGDGQGAPQRIRGAWRWLRPRRPREWLGLALLVALAVALAMQTTWLVALGFMVVCLVLLGAIQGVRTPGSPRRNAKEREETA